MKAGDFLKLARERETIYSFSNARVPKSYVSAILEAARWAPSSHNIQNWSFVVVKNRETIERLLETCYYGGFYALPNVVIAVVNEPLNANSKGLGKGKAAAYLGSHQYLNVGIAAISLVFEAVSLGLGTCILSPDKKSGGRILGIPGSKELVLLVGIGYKDKKSFRKVRVRKLKEDIIWNEKYGKR